MKGWVGLVDWPIADGLPARQLQVERRTGKVRRPETNVLPLCHATNYSAYIVQKSTENVAKSPKFCTLTGNRGRKIERWCLNSHRNTHTHPFNGPLSGTTQVSRYQKGTVKPIWILLKQETVSGSGVSWAICKSAHRSRQITMPAPHHSVFYRPDALSAAQPTVSKHWRNSGSLNNRFCACAVQMLLKMAVNETICSTFEVQYGKSASTRTTAVRHLGHL